MERIVDGILFEGKRLPDRWDVSLWEANGHREVSVRAAVEWVEIGPVPVVKWGKNPLGELDPVADADLIEEKRQRSLRKAAQRAKTQCRRVIKAEGLNELLTLTYRENMQDEEATKRHKKEFVRRMAKALGGEFRHCGAKERQERGAWHWHIACHKLPKHVTIKGVKIDAWKLGTRIWRSIVGADNGLCFVGGKPEKRRWGKPRKARSVAAIADYVSKYILHDYEKAAKGSNRYSRSDVLAPGKPERIVWHSDMRDAIMLACSACEEGHSVVAMRLNTYRDAFWFCSAKDGPAARSRTGSINALYIV